MGLAENAAALAGRTAEAHAELPGVVGQYIEPDIDPADLTRDPDKVDAITAWIRVMGDVRAIGKNQRFDGGRAGKFMFRGVDAVLNAFGPICRRHGVAVLPTRTDAEYRDISTSSGGKMRECTVTVTYRIYGPSGDFIETQTMGEATDTGSRSTPKAQSVALRTLMLTGGMVPTEERDADADPYERGEAPIRSAASYLDEITNPATSVGRLRQIHQELQQTRQAAALVTNEVGDEEPIGQMVIRIGKERAAGDAQ
ncbi:ERF family protein [Kitasatospora sp. NPDC001175]|uniref:ERF family protein n=1 Tax=Kitasatospora sp. NPDC001175 TaxID=3157103 RepID=UPI003D070781